LKLAEVSWRKVVRNIDSYVWYCLVLRLSCYASILIYVHIWLRAVFVCLMIVCYRSTVNKAVHTPCWLCCTHLLLAKPEDFRWL